MSWRTPRYRVTADDVEITPLPPWIHSDVRGEAIRGITLRGSMSVMDDKLTQRIADAFGLHPWVAKVVGVRKFHPSRVKVDLEYRRPVLMVEVPVPGGVGLLPVDVQGAWLPSGDFSPIEANGYPRLAGITSSPVGRWERVGATRGWGRGADRRRDRAGLGCARFAADFGGRRVGHQRRRGIRPTKSPPVTDAASFGATRPARAIRARWRRRKRSPV